MDLRGRVADLFWATHPSQTRWSMTVSTGQSSGRSETGGQRGPMASSVGEPSVVFPEEPESESDALDVVGSLPKPMTLGYERPSSTWSRRLQGGILKVEELRRPFSKIIDVEPKDWMSDEQLFEALRYLGETADKDEIGRPITELKTLHAAIEELLPGLYCYDGFLSFFLDTPVLEPTDLRRMMEKEKPEILSTQPWGPPEFRT